MDAQTILMANQCREEILFIIRLRKADYSDKQAIILEKCPCCIRKMISRSYMMSDEDLNRELQAFNEIIEHICKLVDLSPIL